MWLARDKDGDLNLFCGKPTRLKDFFGVNKKCEYIWELDSELYPEVTWENSPVELVTKL